MTLDMVICPYLVRLVLRFGRMKIWHPHTESEVDDLWSAGVNV